ncbi:hypothetical protein EV702DRAFT_1042590 [Suillus placidus]|uniref:Uncharacterized protein n=1 Tax=Suillus placidus TaxID=48579 RepID=A0A9P7A244_9AGAM|nr:hypothetical protein EV702DRAFT_1042590 [Suillus placidus]
MSPTHQYFCGKVLEGDNAEYWVNDAGETFTFKFPTSVDLDGQFDQTGLYFNLPRTRSGRQHNRVFTRVPLKVLQYQKGRLMKSPCKVTAIGGGPPGGGRSNTQAVPGREFSLNAKFLAPTGLAAALINGMIVHKGVGNKIKSQNRGKENRDAGAMAENYSVLINQQHTKGNPEYDEPVNWFREPLYPLGMDMSEGDNGDAVAIVTTNALREVLNAYKASTVCPTTETLTACAAVDKASQELGLKQYSDLLCQNVGALKSMSPLLEHVTLFEGMPVILRSQNLSIDLGIMNGVQEA